MDKIGILGLILLLCNGIVSYQGLRDHVFLREYSLEVESILKYKEYKRLLFSGFLHTSWYELALNILYLYSLTYFLEPQIGVLNLSIVFFSSLLGGNLFTLFIHRKNPRYTAAGASSAVFGLIFSCIALFPSQKLSLLSLPIHIPVWFFGIIYAIIFIFAFRNNRGSLGIDAHVGGGVTGLVAAMILFPDFIDDNFLPIIILVAPTVVFLFFLFTSPHYLLPGEITDNAPFPYTKDDLYNSSKIESEKEIDEILDKISKKGIKSLTQKEKDKLDRQSQLN